MPLRMLAVTAAFVTLTMPQALAEMHFNRIASFDVSANLPADIDAKTETAPEIIAATADATTLVYTDGTADRVGFVDITDAAAPKAGGSLAVSGEPTSVGIVGSTAFVAINTSQNFTQPSGHLLALNINTKVETGRCDLGGQPDSVAVAPDESFLAIAIENERDEDLNDGLLPQLPGGHLILLPLAAGEMQCAAKQVVNLEGLSDVASDDPEPEFVDINANGETVVTLQENNHIVIIGRDGTVNSHFSAGKATLQNIDVDEERALTFTASQKDRPREPDAVKWIDDDHVAVANEGDYVGGTRDWTIFHKDGRVVYDDGQAFEREIIKIGHYPEKRSGNKGVEPESIEVGTYGNETFTFVGSERGSIVAVYQMNGTTPRLHQLLPSGVAPEGLLAIPGRNLFVTANEKDLVNDKGPRAHVMIYALEDAPARYPTLVADDSSVLFGWTALSGLVADLERPGILYGVNDSFLRLQPRIFTIDANKTPARITGYVDVTRSGVPAQKLDLEGITTDGEGGFWLASEGRTDRLTPHALLNVNAKGEIKKEIAFPQELLSVEKRFGAEGVTRVGTTLWIAIQREWKDDSKGRVKLVSYDVETEEWGAVHYPLDAPAKKGWVGLSEITAHGDQLYVLERDNKLGSAAKVKRLYRISLADVDAAPLGGDLPIVKKTLVRDLLPDLKAWNGYVQDKVEGFAIDVDETAFFLTDNDGVDDHSGETFFWKATGLASKE